MLIYKKSFFSSLALGFFLPLLSYSQFYQLRNFNAENGLPSPEVYGMIQDSKGYMWFTTDMGVSRYNGYEFKNYSTENGLPDNCVLGIFEDKKNRIWFRSLSGKLSYFYNDSIFSLPCNDLLEKEFQKKGGILLSMYVDNTDNIWLGTSTNSLLKISPEWASESVEQVQVNERGMYIYMINEEGLVFGGNANKKCLITLYAQDGNKIVQLDPGIENIGLPGIRCYATRLKDGTFMASVNNVIIHFNEKIIIGLREEKASIICIKEDKNNQLIVGTYNGALRLNKNLELIERIEEFNDNIITDIIIDNENSLWFGAEGQGVYCISFRNMRYYTTANGLPQSKIVALGRKNGYIIIGHLNGSISLINDTVLRLNAGHLKEMASSYSRRIQCIYTDDKAIYISNTTGIYIVTGDKLDNFTEAQGISAKKMIGYKGDTVMLLRSRHLTQYTISNSFKLIKDIGFPYYADDIYMDKKGTVWICALNGVWNYVNDSLIYLGATNKLLRARIINIAGDEKGRLWMASRGDGIIIKDEDKYYQIKEENGLASNMCREMFLDKDNVIWIGSNKGLSKISFTANEKKEFKYEIEIFTKKHGLLTNEVNFINRKGSQLLVVHNNGISVFNPDLLKTNIIAPPIYITSVEINNKVYKSDNLKLAYSNNYLTINYVGLSYKDPGTVEYKYKMGGLDTSWVYTNYTSAQFQTLDPGNYVFMVYARNNAGQWSDHPALLQIKISPLWWQTWLFRICIIVLFLLLVYLIALRRIKIISKREQEKATLKERMMGMELNALRAQMNPHFVFNAINSVQHFITSNDPVSSQKYLAKFAKLIRYVLDNSRLAAIPLEKELEAITLYMEIESLRFENKFDYFIHVDKNIDTSFVHIPSMLMQPYIENSIWHGIMWKKGKGNIHVNVELTGDTIKCTIEDNGIGRKKSEEYKRRSENSSEHRSFGIAITKERLEMINRINQSELSVSIIDLEDETGNALGTKVEIFIPLH